MNRRNDLPPRFTYEEREAYQFAHDCQLDAWLVDTLTKEVTTLDKKYASLVEFATVHGWKGIEDEE